jgi:hypothetical protein
MKFYPRTSGGDDTKSLFGVATFKAACVDFQLAANTIFGVAVFNSGPGGDLLDVHGHCRATALRYTSESAQPEPHSRI